MCARVWRAVDIIHVGAVWVDAFEGSGLVAGGWRTRRAGHVDTAGAVFVSVV